MGKIPASIIRQPPPPRHHYRPLTAASKKEEEEEEEGTRMQNNGGNRDHLSKRRRKKNNSSLPDDIFFEILVHLGAQDIYDATRLVCRKWYNMIYTHNFIYAHLQHTRFGLLFLATTGYSLFVSLRQGRVEISKFTKFRMPAWSSCNGLILEFHGPRTIYVVNPIITNQIFVLPPYNRKSTAGIIFVMAYAAASMEYKVVATCFPRGKDSYMECDILTVGIDTSWRTICGQHVTYKDMAAVRLSRPIMTEGGFVHWVGTRDIILTLNVETEIFTKSHRPSPLVRRPINQRRRQYEGEGGLVTYLPTGGPFLSLFFACGELLWEVWEMKPESGEWRKLFDIDLEDDKRTLKQMRRMGPEYEYLVPIGWLKYLELLVFGFSGFNGSPRQYFVLPYNRSVGDIHELDFPFPLQFCHTRFPHRSSLVWLAGC